MRGMVRIGMAFLLVIATGSGSAEDTEGGGQNSARNARVAAAQALQLRVPTIHPAAGDSLVVGKNNGFGLFDSWPLLPMANEARSYPRVACRNRFPSRRLVHSTFRRRRNWPLAIRAPGP